MPYKKVLDNLSREIAVDYANSGPEHKYSYYMKQYGISKSTFYRLLDRACTTPYLITDEEFYQIEHKLLSNQRDHCLLATNGWSIASQRFWDKRRRIRKQRFFNLVATIPYATKKEMVNAFTDFTISKEVLLTKYKINGFVFGLILQDFIIRGEVTEEDFAKIRKRSLLHAISPNRCITYFNVLSEKRNTYFVKGCECMDLQIRQETSLDAGDHFCLQQEIDIIRRQMERLLQI